MQRFALSVVGVLGLVLAVWGQDLGSEETGAYYINIGMIGKGMGAGFCDSFQAEIRPLLPNEAAQVEWISSRKFFTSTAGVTYRFRQVGEVYHLYKFETGRRPVRVQLIGLMLPTAKKGRYLTQLRAAVPDTYASYNLTDSLSLIGVLGMTAVGRHVTFDFVEGMTSPDGPTESGYPDVVIANAEVMLLRYAYEISVDGLPPRPITPDDRVPSPDDLQGRYKYFDAVMSRTASEPEQTLLDTCFNGSDNIFLGDSATAADLRAIPNVVGGVALNPALPIRCIYVPQRGRAPTRHGSARACFVPIKVAKGGQEFYPIYVFSSAFFSYQTLTNAIVREYYHAQWWHALASLASNDDNESRLREYLLRLPCPWLENDIHYAVINGRTADASPDPRPNLVFRLNNVFSYLSGQLLKNPRCTLAAQSPPWTESTTLITPSLGVINNQPSRLYDVSDGFYASAVWAMARGLDDGKGRVLPLDKIVAQGLPPAPTGTTADTIRANLMDAIGTGYTRSLGFRNARLTAAINALKAEWQDLRPEGCAQAASPFDLVDAVAPNGAFAQDDLSYLQAFSPRVPLPNAFTLRITALITNDRHGANNLMPEGRVDDRIPLNVERDAAMQAGIQALSEQLVSFSSISNDIVANNQTVTNLQQAIQTAQNRANELAQNLGNARTTLDQIQQRIAQNNQNVRNDQDELQENEGGDRAQLQNDEQNQDQALQQYRQQLNEAQQAVNNWTNQLANFMTGTVNPLTQQLQAAQNTALVLTQNLELSRQRMARTTSAKTWQAQVRYLVKRHFSNQLHQDMSFWPAVENLATGLANPAPDLQTFP